MSDYNLNEDEFVLLQEEGPFLSHGRDDDSERIDEVVLTNENLILVNTVNEGLFKTRRMLMRCPLDGLVCSNGRPQMAITHVHGHPYLRIPFTDGAVQLRFSNESARHAQNWANNIAHAALGEFDQISEDNGLAASVMSIPGAESVASLAGGIFSGIRSAAQSMAPTALQADRASRTPSAQSMPHAPTAPEGRGPARCSGCHAPLNGARGTTVTCPYCGTKQTI